MKIISIDLIEFAVINNNRSIRRGYMERIGVEDIQTIYEMAF